MKKIVLILSVFSMAFVSCDKNEVEKVEDAEIEVVQNNRRGERESEYEVLIKTEKNSTTYIATEAGEMVSELTFETSPEEMKEISVLYPALDPGEDVYLSFYNEEGDAYSTIVMEGDGDAPIWQYLLLFCLQGELSYGPGGWSGSISFDCAAIYPTPFTISN